jgi:hypothetical protein
VKRFQCTCSPAWTLCVLSCTDYCSGHPLASLGQAACAPYGQYESTCVCAAGYFGTRCGGSCAACCDARGTASFSTCTSADGGSSCSSARCQCKTGFYGPQCQYEYLWHANCFLANTAAAYDDPSSPLGYVCNCSTGFTGPRCDTPCPASCSRCVATVSGFVCVCPSGFRGSLCTTECPHGCRDSSCELVSGASPPATTCLCSGHGNRDATRGDCACDAGYGGKECSVWLDASEDCPTDVQRTAVVDVSNHGDEGPTGVVRTF